MLSYDEFERLIIDKATAIAYKWLNEAKINFVSSEYQSRFPQLNTIEVELGGIRQRLFVPFNIGQPQYKGASND